MDKMEDRVYKMYEEEMEGILPCSKEETEKLLLKMKQGDETAKNRLIEGHLGQVSDWAQEYGEKGVPISDLVQEGNVALMMAVQAYENVIASVEGEDAYVDAFLSLVESQVRQALKQIVEEQEESNKVGETLAAEINVMNEVTRRLAQEFGREATAEEVAEKMQMEVDEVKELMKIALNAVNSSMG